MLNSLSILKLLQLCSSNLPVGGYTFSQGMEYAIDANWLKTQSDVEAWVVSYASATLRYSDLPLLKKTMAAIDANDSDTLLYLNAQALALRETKELLLADTAMGKALLKLLIDIDRKVPKALKQLYGRRSMRGVIDPSAVSFVAAFAVAACDDELSYQDAATGYAWTVVENQILAAAKLLPMGQTDCQAMLKRLTEQVAELLNNSAYPVDENEIGLSLPGLAMASAKHEDQYSRLYRS